MNPDDSIFVQVLRGEQMHAILLAAFICVSLLLITGCTRATTAVSFEDLCDLTREQFAVMDEESLIQWVWEKHGVVPSELGQQEEDRAEVVLYGWRKGETYRTARLHGGRPVWISMTDIRDGPTFGQVLETLGPPEAVYTYATVYDGTSYGVILEYPAQGLSLGRKQFTRLVLTEVVLSERTQVNTVDCYTPGSLEVVLHQAFGIPAENVPIALQQHKPWPGFGAEVSLDTNP